MQIPIIYENNDILVINKPAGLMVHPAFATTSAKATVAKKATAGEPDGNLSRAKARGNKDLTLCDWILEKYPEIKDVGEPIILSSGEKILRPGIVHRLDRETSGVLVIAKNQESFLFLKKQFQDREIKKTYKAFVYGGFKENEGVIDRPIGRSKSDFRQWSAGRGARGEMRDAVTEYKVVKHRMLDNGQIVSFVEVYPKTGRTHQIRVHFKAISHPIVCDKLYAPKMPCVLGFERVALHAFSIELVLPNGGKKRFEAELPEDFKKALEKIDYKKD